MLDAKELTQNSWWAVPFAEHLGKFYDTQGLFLVRHCFDVFSNASGDAASKSKALLQFCVSCLNEQCQAGNITEEEKNILLARKSPRSAETIADVISEMRNASVALLQSVVREPVYAAEKQQALENNTLTSGGCR